MWISLYTNYWVFFFGLVPRRQTGKDLKRQQTDFYCPKNFISFFKRLTNFCELIILKIIYLSRYVCPWMLLTDERKDKEEIKWHFKKRREQKGTQIAHANFSRLPHLMPRVLLLFFLLREVGKKDSGRR